MMSLFMFVLFVYFFVNVCVDICVFAFFLFPFHWFIWYPLCFSGPSRASTWYLLQADAILQFLTSP